MANGRVKGQISLSGKGRMSIRGNPNSGTNRNMGNTRLANSISISNGTQVSRNSRSKTGYSAHAGQTVGLKGAKTGPGSRRAPIANSVPDKTTTRTSVYNSHVGPTIGLKGAGSPPALTRRTSTNLGSTNANVSTIGLKGATAGGAERRGTRTNLGTDSPDAVTTRGLRKTRKQTGGMRTTKGSAGTLGRTSGGGRKIAFMGNRRQQGSTLAPQKNYNAAIPAAVRRAAARAPSPGSSKPTFTTKVAKITSK